MLCVRAVGLTELTFTELVLVFLPLLGVQEGLALERERGCETLVFEEVGLGLSAVRIGQRRILALKTL